MLFDIDGRGYSALVAGRLAGNHMIGVHHISIPIDRSGYKKAIF